MPVSPIPSHPEPTILTETIDSVRYHLPNAEILLCFDGVRRENEGRRAAYEVHIHQVLDRRAANVCPFIFDAHIHQVGILRAVLDEIRTPLMMFVEQDTPLVTDEPIDWKAITEFILSGHSNLVRLAHEAMIHPEHQHMHHGTEQDGLFTRTSQWSQRPHVASTAFYRRILETCFSPDARSFIEDRMHSVCDEAYKRDGLAGWRQYAAHVYSPAGNIKRSYTTDGRAGEPKYDDTQVF